MLRFFVFIFIVPMFSACNFGIERDDSYQVQNFPKYNLTLKCPRVLKLDSTRMRDRLKSIGEGVKESYSSLASLNDSDIYHFDILKPVPNDRPVTAFIDAITHELDQRNIPYKKANWRGIYILKYFIGAPVNWNYLHLNTLIILF